MISNYEYQYPNNLNEKPKVLFWTFTEMLIIVAVSMASLILFLKSKNVIFVAFAGILALMLAHIDERSIWQYLMDKLKYLFASNIWEYNPSINQNLAKKENTVQPTIELKKQREKNKRKNIIMICLMIFIMIMFICLMFLSSSLSKKQNINESQNAKATESSERKKENSVSMDGIGKVILSKDIVTIQQGEQFDPNSNILSVNDGSGTDYEEVNNTTDLVPNSYCIVADDLNSNVTGTYTVSILTADKDQKYSTSDYKVIVQPEQPDKNPTPES